MDFIVRILFSGLMTFVPSQDGKELTVLLLNVDHGYHVSDGSPLPHHKALVLARAGACAGQCPKREQEVASFLFGGKPPDVALDSLEAAIGGGAVWELRGTELSVRKGASRNADLPPLVIQRNVRGTDAGVPRLVPTTALEREDYSWIASASRVCPECTLDAAFLSAQPPRGRIVARFRLRSGKAFTYAVSRRGMSVAPVRFQRLDGTGPASPYTQAVATWVAAEINVSGSSIELVEQTFAGSYGRSMNLSPDANGRVEIAVLNLPQVMPPDTRNMGDAAAGKHFEVYYDLARNPPARPLRLLPHVGPPEGVEFPEVNWQFVHPQEVIYSELLNKLRLDFGRSAAEPVLCPVSGYP
jgi:hypothetical protein